MAFYKGFRVLCIEKLHQLYSVVKTIEKQINTMQTATPTALKIKVPSPCPPGPSAGNTAWKMGVKHLERPRLS